MVDEVQLPASKYARHFRHVVALGAEVEKSSLPEAFCSTRAAQISLAVYMIMARENRRAAYPHGNNCANTTALSDKYTRVS